MTARLLRTLLTTLLFILPGEVSLGNTVHDSPGDNAVISVGSDARLAPHQHADSLVAIFASAINEGEAGDVVAVFGSARVLGPASGDVVALFGRSYIDSHVGGDAVAVFGDLQLGPDAQVGGDVVAVGGRLTRDPGAIVRGGIQSVLPSMASPRFDGLRNWARQCLLYGRPLALAPGLGWAWTLALILLGLYLLIALIFPSAILRGIETFESEPGQSALAALLSALLIPLVIVALCVTIIGLVAVPFLIVGIMAASLLGKAVMLAWLGHRSLAWRSSSGARSPVLLVLLGGIIALALYVIPLIGLIAYKLLGFLGFGVVVLSVLRASRRRTAEAPSAILGNPQALAPADRADRGPGPGSMAGAMDALSRRPAGFWIRIAALLIDALIVSLVLNLFQQGTHFLLLALACYGAVMWKARGSTIGGIVLGLQVLRQDDRPMDWTTAVVRALGCLLSLIAAGIGFLWIAFDPDKLAWHDRIAGTMVIRTPRKRSPA